MWGSRAHTSKHTDPRAAADNTRRAHTAHPPPPPRLESPQPARSSAGSAAPTPPVRWLRTQLPHHRRSALKSGTILTGRSMRTPPRPPARVDLRRRFCCRPVSSAHLQTRTGCGSACCYWNGYCVKARRHPSRNTHRQCSSAAPRPTTPRFQSMPGSCAHRPDC